MEEFFEDPDGHDLTVVPDIFPINNIAYVAPSYLVGAASGQSGVWRTVTMTAFDNYGM